MLSKLSISNHSIDNSCVVIGGGRWGRIMATKLYMLGFHVCVATNFPIKSKDISREDISRLDPVPRLIYIASKSIDHERDFELVADLGSQVWIEKNFSGMSTSLRDRFLRGNNFLFNQQLFNTSIDRYADIIKNVSDFYITTDVDRRINNYTDLFDWICHDLSLIARIIWLRGETGSLTITKFVEFSQGICTAQYEINGVRFKIVLKESGLRCRTVELARTATLFCGRDGVLRCRTRGGEIDSLNDESTKNEDLLGDALKIALQSQIEHAHSLTRISIELHCAIFPLVSKLNFKGK
jgi:hypothetical protein